MWTDEASLAVSLIKAMFAFAPYLCKLWHKACIANRTSFYSFSWCMDLTVHEYSSIGEKRMSFRRNFNVKLFVLLLIFAAQLPIEIVSEDKCHAL